MITVHDLVEAIAGDVPFFETGERKAMKRQRELEAIEEIRASLPAETGELVAGLWHEFEDRTTPEARFAVAIDNLEVQIQHNLADLSTWLPLEHDLVYTKMDRPCAHDAFLAAFCEAVKVDVGSQAAGGRVRSRRGQGAARRHIAALVHRCIADRFARRTRPAPGQRLGVRSHEARGPATRRLGRASR